MSDSTETAVALPALPARKPLSRARLSAARRTINAWFAAQGWTPFRFQRQVWNAYLEGESGLLHAHTGTGKSYAAWLGPILQWLAEGHDPEPLVTPLRRKQRAPEIPLRVLWITPLRALALDTEQALQKPLVDLNIPWTLESRTGDTKSAVRSRQRKRLPTALITTPESLSLLLSREDARRQFADLRLVVVDEWHELLASKRGVQVELGLARLRRWIPCLRTWGLSATLGNLDAALESLLGSQPAAPGRLVTGGPAKMIRVDSLIPKHIERFPWAGHLGLKLLAEVVEAVEASRTSLVFTNTRYQAEQWYRELLRARPKWAGQIALHHGSLDPKVRRWVENGLRDATLRCVVCTSTLDLGVDFSPVDRVIQIGSPKGTARLLQRAGRSGHQPDGSSRVTCVPTNAFELVEVAAARDAVSAGKLEGRAPIEAPIDVLVQHAVTIALGGGFERQELLDEIRTTQSFRELSDTDWSWVLDFVTRGGPALQAYPDYRRVTQSGERYEVVDTHVARRHRASIGTITSDAALQVKYLRGARLGTIEESFITRLSPGDKFTFAGKRLKLVHIRDMTVWVRRAEGEAGPIPRWMGGRMPLSTELAAAVREKLEQARDGHWDGPEMQAVRPILELQAEWSRIPALDELLIEQIKTREGFHTFFFPFGGRLVHDGLAALLAFRMSRYQPISFAMTVNDYGLELLSADPPPLDEALAGGLFTTRNLAVDILESLNATEMGRRQFREIARIAGLVFGGYPYQPKSAKQLQASAGLLYDVFREYDPESRLLRQAHEEILERQLEHTRLRQVLERLQESCVVLTRPARPTPLAFPLLVDRLRERLSSEKLVDRIRRMQLSLEKAADRTMRGKSA